MSNLIPLRSALTIREQNITRSLPETYRCMVELRQEAPISKLTYEEIKHWCLDIVTIAFSEMTPNGQSDPNILVFQSTALSNELTGKYTQLTISELKQAFKRGIRGESGPYFGMCTRTYHQFIKWFYELPERQEGWMKYLSLINSDSDESGKDLSPNPAGQKKVIEILKQYVDTAKPVYKSKISLPFEKSPRDKFIQQQLAEFDKICDKKPSIIGGRLIPGRYTDMPVTTKIGESENGDPILETKIRPVDVTDFLKIKVAEYDLKIIASTADKTKTE